MENVGTTVQPRFQSRFCSSRLFSLNPLTQVRPVNPCIRPGQSLCISQAGSFPFVVLRVSSCWSQVTGPVTSGAWPPQNQSGAHNSTQTTAHISHGEHDLKRSLKFFQKTWEIKVFGLKRPWMQIIVAEKYLHRSEPWPRNLSGSETNVGPQASEARWGRIGSAAPVHWRRCLSNCSTIILA